MSPEPKSQLTEWQKEHRKKLAAEGIEIAEERNFTHCHRCHRDIQAPEYPKHYRECPGFSSACETVGCPASPEAKRPADGHTSSESSA